MKIHASIVLLASIGSLALETPALSQIATRHLKNPGLPALEPHQGLKADPWLAELGQPELIVPDEFFVEFDPAATAALAVLEDAGREDLGRVGIDSLDETCTRHGVARIRRIAPGVATPELRAKIADGALRDPAGMAVVTVDLERTTLEAAMADFAADPFVMKVEPIGIHRFTAPPNDPLYASQWQFNQTSDRDIDLPEGLDIQNGAPSRIVAVLDTGVRYFHRDLGGSAASLANPTAAEGNMWINTAEKTTATASSTISTAGTSRRITTMWPMTTATAPTWRASPPRGATTGSGSRAWPGAPRSCRSRSSTRRRVCLGRARI